MTGHYSKMLFKYTAKEKQDVFMKTSKKSVGFTQKVTTYFETKTHKRDLIYTWDLETALKYEDVLFILLK